jgi:hypothetical protein
VNPFNTFSITNALIELVGEMQFVEASSHFLAEVAVLLVNLSYFSYYHIHYHLLATIVVSINVS